MLKKVISVLVVVTMMLAMFAGCTPKEPVPPVITDPTTPTPVAPTTESKDTFVWNLGADPRTWDPGLNNASDGGHVINNLFEGLMRDIGGGKLEPAQAESYEISKDGLTYTFTLKSGLKWSDGKPLTAKDFEYSWKRVCLPATASEYSFILAPYIVGGEDLLNNKEPKDEQKLMDAMGVKAVDDTTLEVKLNVPVPYFLALTTFYTYLPVRADMVATGDGWDKSPKTCISNGPFMLSEYQTGSHITMVKNENYWDAAKVQLKKLKGLMIVEATTALNGYKAGEIALLDSGAIPPNEIPNLTATDPYFSTAPRVGTYYAIFNCDQEPTNDVRVRKALTLAIDQKKITEQVTKGGQIPATGFIPPSLKFSTGESCRKLDENGNPLPEYGIDPNKAQVEEAKALLAEAGYPDGKGFPNIDFYYNTGEAHKLVAEALQEMWKVNLGIDIKLKNEEWSIFQDTRRLGNTLISRGGWLGDYDDPMTMLDLYTSASGNNDSQWRWTNKAKVAEHDKVLNPEEKAFDEAIEKIRKTSGAERDKAIVTAETIMMENMIILPIYYYTYVQLINESVVEGVNRTTMGHWSFKNVKMIG